MSSLAEPRAAFGAALLDPRSEAECLRLLDSHPSLATTRLADGMPLLLAVTFGRVEVVRRLLGLGAEPDRVEPSSPTRPAPLHVACVPSASRSPVLASLLLASGADPDIRDGRGCTPLHVVASVARDLRRSVDPEETDTCTLAGLLLDHGADLEARASGLHDATPLYLAAHFGHARLARLLLERGAQVNARCRRGHTPLDVAFDGGECQALLRSRGGRFSSECSS